MDLLIEHGIGSNKGSKAGVNIFVQPTQPSNTQKGIWIKENTLLNDVVYTSSIGDHYISSFEYADIGEKISGVIGCKKDENTEILITIGGRRVYEFDISKNEFKLITTYPGQYSDQISYVEGRLFISNYMFYNGVWSQPQAYPDTRGAWNGKKSYFFGGSSVRVFDLETFTTTEYKTSTAYPVSMFFAQHVIGNTLYAFVLSNNNALTLKINLSTYQVVLGQTIITESSFNSLINNRVYIWGKNEKKGIVYDPSTDKISSHIFSPVNYTNASNGAHLTFRENEIIVINCLKNELLVSRSMMEIKSTYTTNFLNFIPVALNSNKAYGYYVDSYNRTNICEYNIDKNTHTVLRTFDADFYFSVGYENLFSVELGYLYLGFIRNKTDTTHVKKLYKINLETRATQTFTLPIGDGNGIRYFYNSIIKDNKIYFFDNGVKEYNLDMQTLQVISNNYALHSPSRTELVNYKVLLQNAPQSSFYIFDINEKKIYLVNDIRTNNVRNVYSSEERNEFYVYFMSEKGGELPETYAIDAETLKVTRKENFNGYSAMNRLFWDQGKFIFFNKYGIFETHINDSTFDKPNGTVVIENNIGHHQRYIKETEIINSVLKLEKNTNVKVYLTNVLYVKNEKTIVPEWYINEGKGWVRKIWNY